MTGPWREPSDESIDLYPGLVVHDGRVAGAITTGRSRLPVSALVYEAIHGDWDDDVEFGWSPEANYGWTADHMSDFLHDLLEVRGEFARLLLVLADGERIEREDDAEDGYLPLPWWETDHAAIVKDQLRRCLAALAAEADQ